jgi:glycerophosphoryl diester phosphodiesterase
MSFEIIAHRGASHDAPENTLAAVALAWSQGADAVEIDVRLSRDGVIVLLHDVTFARTTGHPGTAESLDTELIRGLDAGLWKSPAHAGERVPLLAEVLEAVPPARKLVIELKAGPEIVPVLKRTLEAGPLPLSRVMIIAFDQPLLAAAKAALPAATVLLLAGGAWEQVVRTADDLDVLIQRARASAFDGLNLGDDWPLTPELVQRIHAAGLRCYVWTVNDAGRARELMATGLDGLATDRPGWLRTQLAEARA